MRQKFLEGEVQSILENVLLFSKQKKLKTIFLIFTVIFQKEQVNS